MPRKERPSKRSLSQFMKDAKRQSCEVCQLPKALYAEIKAASSKRIPQGIILEWLQVEHGVTITKSQLLSHYSAKHDYD